MTVELPQKLTIGRRVALARSACDCIKVLEVASAGVTQVLRIEVSPRWTYDGVLRQAIEITLDDGEQIVWPISIRVAPNITFERSAIVFRVDELTGETKAQIPLRVPERGDLKRQSPQIELVSQSTGLRVAIGGTNFTFDTLVGHSSESSGRQHYGSGATIEVALELLPGVEAGQAVLQLGSSGDSPTAVGTVLDVWVVREREIQVSPMFAVVNKSQPRADLGLHTAGNLGSSEVEVQVGAGDDSGIDVAVRGELISIRRAASAESALLRGRRDLFVFIPGRSFAELAILVEE